MQVLKKEQIYGKIWKLAEEHRGSIDGWEFKNYILTFLFYRYISENITYTINKEMKTNNPDNYDFDFSKISDEEAQKLYENRLISAKGFYIKPSNLFLRFLDRIADNIKELNVELEKVFKEIEENSEIDGHKPLAGLLRNVQLNDAIIGQDTFTRNKRIFDILQSIKSFDLGDFNQNSTNNVPFGDAYEYLISMYSSAARESAWKFFTPQEVSELLAEITSAYHNKLKVKTIYDPTCGFGSSLLKFAKKFNINDINIYGQENNPTIYKLCKINMFLHSVAYDKFDIQNGDTLLNPKHIKQKFDIIVSNPPYRLDKWQKEKDFSNDPRFKEVGIIPPDWNADFAFLLHIYHQLETTGVAAVVGFVGSILWSAQKNIRKFLIQNSIETVIKLPRNIFFGKWAQPVILVLRKTKQNEKILFIDASEMFVEDKTNGELKNKLLKINIDEILDIVKNNKEIKNVSRIVSLQEIEDNDWNLDPTKNVKRELQIYSNQLLTLKEVHISEEEFDQKYKIYKKNFEESLENPEYTNIAITGDYGIGKSTIFKSFLKNNDKYKDKYVEVIIGNYKNQKDDLATTVLLEKQIINQLVSQIDSKKIPLSKYKLSFKTKWTDFIWISSVLIVLLTLPALIIGINRFWSQIPNVGEKDWLKFLIISILSTLPIIVLLLWKIKNIVHYLHKIILKFKFADLEVEMEINKLSEFDNNLAELIYIFSRCKKHKKNIFVFEDLDRFGNNLIFQKLKELNLIVNKFLHISDKHTNDKKISFIYLVKPDLFKKYDDFLKFFDISIPIIPFINNFDSMVYFKRIFHKKHWENWNFRILVRSTHKLFNNVREINNLHNEFVIYWEQNKDEYYSDETSILSFLILKNKFPKTYKKLLNHQSELFRENANQPLIIIQYRNEILNKLNKEFEEIEVDWEKKLIQNEITNKILRYSIFSSLWYNSPNDRKINCTKCGRSYNFYEFYNYCIYMKNPFYNQEFLDTKLKQDDKYNNYLKDIYNKNDFFELLKNQGTNIASLLKYGSSKKLKKLKKKYPFFPPLTEEYIKRKFQYKIKNKYLEINSIILDYFDNYEYDSISLIFAISKILNEQKTDESNLNKLIKCIFEINEPALLDDELYEYCKVIIKLFWLVDNEVKIKFIKEIVNWEKLEEMINALDDDSLFNFFDSIYNSDFFSDTLISIERELYEKSDSDIKNIQNRMNAIKTIKDDNWDKINELRKKIQKERKMKFCFNCPKSFVFK